MANESQIENWDGPAGQYWAAEAERYDRMSQAFLDRIVADAAPRPGERVLDVGCGNGALALAVARLVRPGGTVTGLDISSPMLDTARRRAEQAGVDNVDFERGDAQVHDLDGQDFDAVVSRFGVMFFEDPVAAFANLASALRPGGRFVATCWRELLDNEWIMVPAVAALAHVPMPELGDAGGPGPFSLADESALRSLLDRAGFDDVRLEAVELPVVMGADLDDAIDFMRHGDMAEILLSDAPADVAAEAWAAIRASLEPHETETAVRLMGAAWIVSGRRPG